MASVVFMMCKGSEMCLGNGHNGSDGAWGTCVGHGGGGQMRCMGDMAAVRGGGGVCRMG